MKIPSLLCAVAAAAALAGPADAVYKCTTAKGVIYQDRPCRDGNETDVRIVIPTGEVAPRISPASDEGTATNSARNDNSVNAPKAGRTAADDPVSVAKPADTKTNNAAVNTSDNARKKEARTSADNAAAALTAEQARKTDPSAKYYATEAFGSGSGTPAQMNCESPTGEKRVFYLSDGKLTSI